MTYIATAKDIPVLGQKFQSFLDESGEVVFSLSSTATGLDLSQASRVFEILNSKKFKALSDNGFETSRNKLKTNINNRAISVVTKPELVMLVSYLAERGHDRAVAMQQASFSVMLQMSVDSAYGVERDRQEYIDKATEAAKWLEERRAELRRISASVTNPTIACNLYSFNNELVYGIGVNRDSYDEEDAANKHFLVTNLESIQAGLKMAGMTIEEIKEMSFNIYNTKLNR